MASNISQLTAALVDRYRIERELGAGGMATVYLAHDVRHDRKVALKVLRPELSAILGAERFLAEIKTTANLQHPHILALFDSGEAAGLVFYVMPFVEGESLRDRLKRDHQLPVEEAVRLAREVADALEYAHQHGIVHRDIKPENILLHGGHAVVADFGIALAASRSEGGARMTETGMSLGTPHYMSPEQAMGEREITPKTDIYALGCVVYEMLTAEPPFTGASAQAIIGRVLTEEPRSLTAQRKTIPPNVEAAVQKALSKLPADRFNSAKEFGEALGRSDYVPLGTHARTAAVSAGGAAVAKWRGAAPWAVAAVAVIVALATALWPAPPAPTTWQRTVIWQVPVPAGDVGLLLAISPDGNTIAYLDTVGGTQQLHSKERRRLESVPLTGTVGAYGPAFSHDGEWITFVAEGKLKRVPRLGGSPITIAEGANSTFPASAWLEDGTILYNDPDFNLLALPPDGGAARRVVAVDSAQLGVVSVSPLPGGRGVLMILCNFGCPNAYLYVLDLRSGESKRLVEAVNRAWYLPNGMVAFVRQDGGVLGAPFDLDDLEFTSPPVPLLDGVRSTSVASDAVLSRSGTLLFVAGSGVAGGLTSEMVSVSRTGTIARIDPSWSFPPAAFGGLAVSPNGRLLALSLRGSDGDDIWIKELPAGGSSRLTFEGSNLRPVWTPDGREVLYTAARGPTSGDVFRRRADGTGTARPFIDARREVIELALTPDTLQFIVRFAAPPSRDIFLATIGRDSTTVAPLMAGSFQEIGPSLSSDGRWLAYSSDETGRPEIYVRPYPDVNAGRWQVSRDGGTNARWARSGSELFYIDGAGMMVSASVAPGATFAIREQRTLFSTSGLMRGGTIRMWDVTPDDRSFIFSRPVAGSGGGAASGAQVVIQVDNWFTHIATDRARRP